MDPTPGTNPEGRPDDPDRNPEDDARRFVEQLRSTPADEIVAEVFSTFLTAAEVKLGRRDARLFIDLCAALSQHAAPYVPGELGQQVEKALGQLRLAQVSAESHRDDKGEPEPNDLARSPTPPTAGQPAQPPSDDRPTESPLSRLWIPGR